MATAKDLVVKPVSSQIACEVMRSLHYSGIAAINSCLNYGIFLNGKIEGAIQLGPSLAKRKVIGLVNGTKWHEFIEINRMALSDNLPLNSESRSLGIVIRSIKKNAPQLKWIISYADGTRCGDGTIYRAAGFILTGITENHTMWKLPNGFVFADVGLRASSYLLREKVGYRLGEPFSTFRKRVGAVRVSGFQLRYIYFLDPTYRSRLTVPELPYSEIERRGAGMYKGKKRETGEIDSAAQSNEQTGGASPTVSLSPVIQDESG